MCSTCGCSPDNHVKILTHDSHENLILPKKSIKLQKLELKVLGKNDSEAAHNRVHFEKKKVTAINLVSSPGSGKTTLLEKTILGLKDQIPLYIIEGDQYTMQDAMRIKTTGAPVVQINTGKACHLDAAMVHGALHQMEPSENSILFIENVGNLVCPALFDLGEKYRVVIISVTEGDDKPLKYPHMFESSNICIINKIDLLPYVNFNIDNTKEYATRVNHKLQFFEVSATRGDGMDRWFQWLMQKHMEITL